MADRFWAERESFAIESSKVSGPVAYAGLLILEEHSTKKGNIFSTDRLLLLSCCRYCCFRLLSFASSCFLSRKLLLTTEAAARHKLGVEFAAWFSFSSYHPTISGRAIAFLYFASAFPFYCSFQLCGTDHLLWLLLWLI